MNAAALFIILILAVSANAQKVDVRFSHRRVAEDRKLEVEKVRKNNEAIVAKYKLNIKDPTEFACAARKLTAVLKQNGEEPLKFLKVKFAAGSEPDSPQTPREGKYLLFGTEVVRADDYMHKATLVRALGFEDGKAVVRSHSFGMVDIGIGPRLENRGVKDRERPFYFERAPQNAGKPGNNRFNELETWSIETADANTFPIQCEAETVDASVVTGEAGGSR